MKNHGPTIVRLFAASFGIALLAAGAAAGVAPYADGSEEEAAGCSAPAGQSVPEPLGPTTIATIQQAYNCIFDHYYDGQHLDNRDLLTAAFAAFTQELNRHGQDAATATLPALPGDRRADWDAFASAYQRALGELPDDPSLRQALAAATLDGMVRSLDDNHARWQRSEIPPGYEPGKEYGLGITTSPSSGLMNGAPQEALPPLYVRTVLGGSAAEHKLRPGDVIEAINGAPPFAGGMLSTGAVRQLYPSYPDTAPVRLTLRRPSTGRTWTVRLTPMLYNPTGVAPVTAKLLRNGTAYVRLTGFTPNSADAVLRAIAGLGKPKAVVLDLRGNRGGATQEANRLLGAFMHGKVTAYLCDGSDTCTANLTDDSVPLLNVPLAVLTDRDCASACDHFTSAIKAQHAGTLVGTRTAGIVSGPATPYVLNDNSALLLPALYHLGPNREVVNRIGTAPDHHVPLTADDVSKGRDPVLAAALTFLADR